VKKCIELPGVSVIYRYYNHYSHAKQSGIVLFSGHNYTTLRSGANFVIMYKIHYSLLVCFHDFFYFLFCFCRIWHECRQQINCNQNFSLCLQPISLLDCFLLFFLFVALINFTLQQKSTHAQIEFKMSTNDDTSILYK